MLALPELTLSAMFELNLYGIEILIKLVARRVGCNV